MDYEFVVQLIDLFTAGEPDAARMALGVVMVAIALMFIYSALEERGRS